MKRRILCLLFAMVMLLSVVAFPSLNVQATGEDAAADPIAAERILYDFRAENFTLPYAPDSGDAIVDDADSAYGKAVMLSYEKRVPTGDKGLLTSLTRLGDQQFCLYTYGGDPKVITEFGMITQTQLRANAEAGQYILYHFEDVELIPDDQDYFIYLFDCWGFQQRFTADQKAALQGQIVDVYMSMKVTGDISATEGNTPSYYIDRLVIATSEAGSEQHEHTYGEWKAANDFNHESVCTIAGCGEAKTEAHTWGEPVVTKEPTTEASGEETYTCTICQATRTKKLAMLSGGSNAGTQSGNNDAQSQNPDSNMGMWIAIGMFAVAAIVVVVALVVRKREKK